MFKTYFSIAALSCVFLACEAEDELGDGGLDGGIDAAVDAELPPVYTWVIIQDESREENMAGAPGADICGVSFYCDDHTGVGVQARLDVGDGEICVEGQSVNGEPCFADRGDAAAAIGTPQDPCEANSSPSDYVALGMGGVLAVRLDTADADLADLGGLSGCTITVMEREGRETERYTVDVCEADTVDADSCIGPVPFKTHSRGGAFEFDVP